MANSQSRREAAKLAAKVDEAKNELIELSGENVQYAFQEVRLDHDQNGTPWLDAYRKVNNRLRAEQRDASDDAAVQAAARKETK